MDDSMPRQLIRVRRMATTGTARTIREDAGLSLAELATAVGVNRATIWRWENGRRRPRGNRAIKYLRALEELAAR